MQLQTVSCNLLHLKCRLPQLHKLSHAAQQSSSTGRKPQEQWDRSHGCYSTQQPGLHSSRAPWRYTDGGTDRDFDDAVRWIHSVDVMSMTGIKKNSECRFYVSQPAHTEALGELRFILAFVHCVMELASSKELSLDTTSSPDISFLEQSLVTDQISLLSKEWRWGAWTLYAIYAINTHTHMKEWRMKERNKMKIDISNKTRY